MASSMHTQVFEHLSILDEALLQPDKFIGLKLAVGSEIPGFGHDTRVSELTDDNRDLFPTTRPVARPDLKPRTGDVSRCLESSILGSSRSPIGCE